MWLLHDLGHLLQPNTQSVRAFPSRDSTWLSSLHTEIPGDASGTEHVNAMCHGQGLRLLFTLILSTEKCVCSEENRASNPKPVKFSKHFHSTSTY